MKTWLIDVKEVFIRRVIISVPDDSPNHGYSEARELACSTKGGVIVNEYKDIISMTRDPNPWLNFICWYDLHGPGDVIVAEPATGHKFTERDINTLKQRLSALGLIVEDSWNGAGCNTVSFKCSGRIGEEGFTEEQLAYLNTDRT